MARKRPVPEFSWSKSPQGASSDPATLGHGPPPNVPSTRAGSEAGRDRLAHGQREGELVQGKRGSQGQHLQNDMYQWIKTKLPENEKPKQLQEGLSEDEMESWADRRFPHFAYIRSGKGTPAADADAASTGAVTARPGVSPLKPHTADRRRGRSVSVTSEFGDPVLAHATELNAGRLARSENGPRECTLLAAEPLVPLQGRSVSATTDGSGYSRSSAGSKGSGESGVSVDRVPSSRCMHARRLSGIGVGVPGSGPERALLDRDARTTSVDAELSSCTPDCDDTVEWAPVSSLPTARDWCETAPAERNPDSVLGLEAEQDFRDSGEVAFAAQPLTRGDLKDRDFPKDSPSLIGWAGTGASPLKGQSGGREPLDRPMLPAEASLPQVHEGMFTDVPLEDLSQSTAADSERYGQGSLLAEGQPVGPTSAQEPARSHRWKGPLHRFVWGGTGTDGTGSSGCKGVPQPILDPGPTETRLLGGHAASHVALAANGICRHVADIWAGLVPHQETKEAATDVRHVAGQEDDWLVEGDEVETMELGGKRLTELNVILDASKKVQWFGRWDKGELSGKSKHRRRCTASWTKDDYVVLPGVSGKVPIPAVMSHAFLLFFVGFLLCCCAGAFLSVSFWASTAWLPFWVACFLFARSAAMLSQAVLLWACLDGSEVALALSYPWLDVCAGCLILGLHLQSSTSLPICVGSWLVARGVWLEAMALVYGWNEKGREWWIALLAIWPPVLVGGCLIGGQPMDATWYITALLAACCLIEGLPLWLTAVSVKVQMIEGEGCLPQYARQFVTQSVGFGCMVHGVSRMTLLGLWMAGFSIERAMLH